MNILRAVKSDNAWKLCVRPWPLLEVFLYNNNHVELDYSVRVVVQTLLTIIWRDVELFTYVFGRFGKGNAQSFEDVDE